MSLKIKKTKELKKIEIDLTGPEGNVFVLIGKGCSLLKQLKHSDEDIEIFKKEMMSSDYVNAVRHFHDTFSDFVELEMSEDLYRKIVRTLRL